MRAQHCSTSPRYRLKSIFYHYFVVLFAIPVATFGRVDRGSKVEVNIYPIGLFWSVYGGYPTFNHISVIFWPSVYGGYPTFNHISVISWRSVYGGYLTFNNISVISWASVYGGYPTFNHISVISLAVSLWSLPHF